MGNDMNRNPNFQEIAQMKYLDLFIKEAQRVYPSVPFIGRYCDKDYDISKYFVIKINIHIILILNYTLFRWIFISQGHHYQSSPSPARLQ